MSSVFVSRVAAPATMIAVLLAACCFGFAQDQQSVSSPPQPQTSSPAPGWHRFYAPAPAAADPPSQNNSLDPDAPGNQASNADPSSEQPDARQDSSIPARLIIEPGTFVTVRIDQTLSSNRNRTGDLFTATLEKPVVVHGLVVAQKGETVGGRVVYAKKAGRIKGVSQLAVRLTDLTLVDGQPMAIQTHLIGQRGPRSRGRDAGAIAATTALGAGVGAAASGGIGAAIGAGAGAIAGTVGVLVTRGHPVVIYPESLLTFRIEAPVTVSTVRAPQAFRNVEEDAYARPSQTESYAPAPRNACAGYGCPPPYNYYASYPFYYGFASYPFYPYYFGRSFYFGRGFYGFGHGGFRGYRR